MWKWIAGLVLALAADAFAGTYYVNNAVQHADLPVVSYADGSPPKLIVTGLTENMPNQLKYYGVRVVSGAGDTTDRYIKANSITGDPLPGQTTIDLNANLGTDADATSFVTITYGSDANTGAYPTSDGDGTGPFRTIQYSADTAGAAEGSHTVNIAAGTYTEVHGATNRLLLDASTHTKTTFVGASAATTTLTSADTTYKIYMNSAKSYEFQNLSITNTNAQWTFYRGSTGALTFTSCILTQTKAYNAPNALIGESSTTVSSGDTFTNCAITTKNFIVGNSLTTGKAGPIVFSGGSIDFTENYAGVMRLIGVVGSVSISGVAFTDSTAAGHCYLFAELTSNDLQQYTGVLSVRSCTGTVGSIMKQAANGTRTANNSRIGSIILSDNTLSLSAPNAPPSPISFGYEVDTGGTHGGVQTIDSSPFHSIQIARNAFTFTKTGATHIVFLGIGANGAVIVDNTFDARASTAAYGGFVIKSDGNTIARNRIYAGNEGIYLSGGCSNVVTQNTVYTIPKSGSSTMVLHIDTNQDKAVTSPVGPCARAIGNTITDNVFVTNGTGSADFAVCYDPNGDDSAITDPPVTWKNYIARNVYSTGGANVAEIGGTTVAKSGGIAAVRARWAAYLGTSALGTEDTGSRIVSMPLLNPSSLTTGFKANSSIRTSGSWLNVIPGAWQRGEMVGTPPFWNLARPSEK